MAVVAGGALLAGAGSVVAWTASSPTGAPGSGETGSPTTAGTTPVITVPAASGAAADGAGARSAGGTTRSTATGAEVPGARPAIPVTPPGSSARSRDGASAPAAGAQRPSRPQGAGSSGTTGTAGTAVLEPVPVGRQVGIGDGVQARVESVTGTRIRPLGPGDIAGPGASVVVSVRNTSDAAVDLAGLAVTASDPDGVPAIPSSGEPSDVLTGVLPAGAERTGTYVFGLRGPAGAGGSTGPGDPPELRLEVGLSSAPEVAVVVTR